jgi:anti-sigma factor RsiW
MTDCSTVLQHLSEYLDEELPPGTCEEIASHLSTCTDCDVAKQQLLRSIEVCRQFRSADGPAELPAEVREALKAAYLRVRNAGSKA